MAAAPTDASTLPARARALADWADAYSLAGGEVGLEGSRIRLQSTLPPTGRGAIRAQSAPVDRLVREFARRGEEGALGELTAESLGPFEPRGLRVVGLHGLGSARRLSRAGARIRWAVLLARIYDVLPLLCPACGADMRILAFLTDPPVVSAILLHFDLPHKRPPSPARGPPQSDLLTGLLDQTPAFDPTEPEPVPDFDFDQSLPDDFDL